MSSKLREALEEMVEYAQAAACHCQDAQLTHYLSQIIAWGKKALNEPILNYEVGTAEEQIERHGLWCVLSKPNPPCCKECEKCFARWSQMPYEEVK